MSAAKIPRISGSRAQEVQAKFVGPHDDILNGLGPDLFILGPLPSPDLQRYLESIRDRLLARWPYEKPTIPFRIEILPSSGYAADSFADGVIRIPVGLISEARSEDEIAFIVGHEAAHLLLKHQIRREDQISAAEHDAQAALLLGQARLMRESKHKHAETRLITTAKALEHSTAQTTGKLVLGDVVQVVFDAGWSRKQEEQADLIGIDLITAAGYNPSYTDQVFDAVLKTESAAAEDSAGIDMPASISPQNIAAFLAKLNPADLINDQLYTWNKGIKALAISHPATAARKEAAGNYRDKFYTDATGRVSNTNALQRLKRSTAFITMLDAIRLAKAANQSLEDGNIGDAVSQARAAEQALPRWWATHYLAGLGLLQQQQTSPGLAELQTSITLPDVPYGVFERLAFEYTQRRNVPKALSIMTAADRHFGGPEVTWPDKIVLYKMENSQGGVNSTLGTCNKSDNARQREKCEEAAKRPVALVEN